MNHRLKARAILAAVGLASFSLLAAAQDLCGRPREAPSAVYDRLKSEKLKESFRDKAYAAVNDEAKGVVWTFTVPGHPAHPSVVCRRIIKDGADMRLETQVQCNASEAECERLVKAFQELNHRMLQDMKKQQKK
jgi:hypothetical protein